MAIAQIMLFAMCHFFVKKIVLFEILTAIYFSMVLTFSILGVSLFIFLKCFPLDFTNGYLEITAICSVNDKILILGTPN